MNHRRSLHPLVVILTLVIGCKSDKRDDEPAEKTTAAERVDETPKTSSEGATADEFVHIEINHDPPKSKDPVVVKFPSVKVVSADFDPQNLEGATAEVQVDVGSLDSGNKERSKNLLAPEYLDVKAHPSASARISDVESIDGDRYMAKVAIGIHGVQQEWSVEFKVIDRSESHVTIYTEHKFERTAFDIGEAVGDSAAVEALLKAQLTFRKAG